MDFLGSTHCFTIGLMLADYLSQKHAAYHTSEATLFTLVQTVMGQEPLSRQIMAGEDNEVYKIRVQQGQPLIARIHRQGQVSFQAEAWAIGQCQRVGMKVPCIRHLGYIETDEGVFEIRLQDCV